MADHSLATISLITSAGDNDDDPTHMQLWIIPSASAETFARLMTERYGQPVEAIGTVGATKRAHQEHDRNAYISDGDQFRSRDA